MSDNKELEQEMHGVAEAIRETMASRAQLRQEMEAWYGGGGRGRFPGHQRLAELDETLSDLDTHFKLLWDTLHPRNRQPAFMAPAA